MIWLGEIYSPSCFDGPSICVVAREILGHMIRIDKIFRNYIYIYIFDLNNSLSATKSMLLNIATVCNRYISAFRFLFQVLGAEQPLPVSTSSYFEVKVLHNPDTRGGLALGVCGHLPSGTETHSIRRSENCKKGGRIEEWFWFLRGWYLQIHNQIIYIYIHIFFDVSHF